jgi:hypothetical protein
MSPTILPSTGADTPDSSRSSSDASSVEPLTGLPM